MAVSSGCMKVTVITKKEDNPDYAIQTSELLFCVGGHCRHDPAGKTTGQGAAGASPANGAGKIRVCQLGGRNGNHRSDARECEDWSAERRVDPENLRAGGKQGEIGR